MGTASPYPPPSSCLNSRYICADKSCFKVLFVFADFLPLGSRTHPLIRTQVLLPRRSPGQTGYRSPPAGSGSTAGSSLRLPRLSLPISPVVTHRVDVTLDKTWVVFGCVPVWEKIADVCKFTHKIHLNNSRHLVPGRTRTAVSGVTQTASSVPLGTVAAASRFSPSCGFMRRQAPRQTVALG